MTFYFGRNENEVARDKSTVCSTSRNFIHCVPSASLALRASFSSMSIQKGFCHLLALMLFQTCMHFFLLLNTKEDIVKSTDNQTVLVPIVFFVHIMKGNGNQNCICQHSLKLFCVPYRSNRYEITRGWVNDDNIFIYEWTMRLNSIWHLPWLRSIFQIF